VNIYIACGLTHVPRDHFDDYVRRIHAIAKNLEGCGHQVKYALINSDPQLAKCDPRDQARLCYEWDRNMVEECDLVVAEATYPSTGLGIELQIAAGKDLPIVICYDCMHSVEPVKYQNPDHSKHQLQIGSGHVTLMALGLPSVKKEIGYRDEAELMELLNDVANALERPGQKRGAGSKGDGGC